MMKHKKVFPQVIGQDKAKKRLAFYLESQRATGIVPHLMFVAPKGCGKTYLAEQFASKLPQRGNPKLSKGSATVNCSKFKNLDDLLDFFSEHIHKEFTFILDECHMFKDRPEAALLTVLNPNSKNKNTLVAGDTRLNFDFKRHTFILATTESHKVFAPLMDRCTRVDLEDYTLEEIARIVELNLDDNVEFDNGVLDEIATTLRGNARDAYKCTQGIEAYLKINKKNKFTRKDWENHQDTLSIYPLGLNESEMKVLRLLGKGGYYRLTEIHSGTELSREAIRQNIELYLIKNRLIKVTANGRVITQKGKDYLKSCSV